MDFMQMVAAFNNTGYVASTGNTTTSNSNSGSSPEPARSELDKDAFFKLLVTQLRHQDPLSPMDNTQFVAQVAQFTSLEQMTNMNNTMEQFLKVQALSEGTSLIGKTIETIADENGDYLKGKVTKIAYEEGELYLYLGNTDTRVHIDNVVRVY
jgi:flagellar basal-body rod modification protein FlgD